MVPRLHLCPPQVLPQPDFKTAEALSLLMPPAVPGVSEQSAPKSPGPEELAAQLPDVQLLATQSHGLLSTAYKAPSLLPSITQALAFRKQPLRSLVSGKRFLTSAP